MDKRHIIEDAEFDIAFDSVAAAREHEPGLAAFIRERLLPLADEIFCELSDDGMVARIDRLEIDLGAIHCNGFHDEMESRFREKLRSYLLEKMRSFATEHSPGEGAVGRRQAEREQMEVFLETGRMPWHAERTPGADADAMLEQTLRHQGDAFAGFLRRTPHRDSVVKRLARQFPDRLLVDVMQLLAPAHASLLGDLTGKLGEIWKKQSAGISDKEFKSLVWERLLGEHLKAEVPDPARLLRNIVKELFIRNARPADLSGKRMEGEPAVGEFMYEVRDAADGLGETLVARQPEGDGEWMSSARLRALLEAAFATGDAGALSGQWEALRKTHRDLVRAVFMQRMGDERLRQKLAEGFPETLLAELLDILSPQDSGFMLALSGLPELRGAGGVKNAGFWRYTLDFLHGSAAFGRAEYARGLLRHMSEQGIAQRQLAQALAGIAPELEEAQPDLPETTATDADHAEEPARAGELYRGLVGRLTGASGTGPQFIEMMKELENAYPETHARLLRQLQSGEVAADIGALTMDEVRQLVVSLIRLDPGSQELLGAIGSQEYLAQDTEGYYRHILDKLVRNQAVDVEAAAADEGAQDGMQTPSKAGAALGRALSERQEVRASVRDKIARMIEAERADALYSRLEQRLGGMRDGQDMVPAIKRLASAYPETLARLKQRLQTGELRADVRMLDGREARQLVMSLIRLSSGAKESEFLRAIERYAGRARDEAGYFRHILENMVRNQTIDLEEAVRSHATDDRREGPHAARKDAGMDDGDRHGDQEMGGAGSLDPAGLLRIRLEEALALGRAERVAGVWGELLSGRADMLREVFMSRLGDETMRGRLANGFPESMLQEMVRALLPQAGRDIERLAAQPGLRASGATDAKNVPFWEYTLSYLHASGLLGYEWSGYAQGLVRHLSERGMSQADLQQAVALVAPAGGTATNAADDRQDAEDISARAMRDDEPVRKLLRRLTGQDGPRDSAQEIAELSDGRQEAAREFYRRLRSGDVALDATVLTAREARLLIAAFIAANHGSMGEDIRREIEAHAGNARDERCYYQTVLEMLVRNRVLDIEQAMAALPAEAAGEQMATVRAEAGGRAVSGSLRARFESALMRGDAGEIADVWNDLRFNYGNLVREVFNLRMGDGFLRRQLAERFPEAMLFELIFVLAPLAGGFIQSLERQLGLQAGAAKPEAVRRAAREQALSYLHAFGARGFRRADYVRDLMRRMAAEGVDGNVFLRALEAVDPVLAKSLPGHPSVDTDAVDVQRVPADRLRALLEAAFATGDAGVLSGQWEALRKTHRELVCAVFMRRMGDERLRQKLAEGFPETLLAELLELLSPQDSGFMLALSGLPELRGAGGAKNAGFWRYTLGYLHGSAAFDRAEYARGLLRHLSAQGAVRRQLAQALAGIAPELEEALDDLAQDTEGYYRHILDKLVSNQAVDVEAAVDEAVQGNETTQPKAHSAQGGDTFHDEETAQVPDAVHSPDRQAIATIEPDAAGTSTVETERAGELYRRVAQHLSGSGSEPEFPALVEEMANDRPEMLAHLLRQLQSGELRADVGLLDGREGRQLVTALIRLNSGAKESDFLRAVERQAGRAKSEAGYFRHILESLLHNRNIDLEEAASVSPQEAGRQIPADDRDEEIRVLPSATSGDRPRPQMAEDGGSRATAGDQPMQVENASAFDGRVSEDDSESTEEIYIANAGMVLATPYLPQLFRMLDLTEGTKFRDERAAERAIHLLQFMVNESCDSPEFLLSLNKLLCGVPTGVPIVREIELLQKEKETIEGMLNGIIRNWTILGNTSVQGLRESFLQRNGRLQLKEDNWHLKVESKGIDVLLDRLPWSFALIRHPWMRRPIYVEWR